MSDLDLNQALQRIVAKGRLTRADARAALGLPPESEGEKPGSEGVPPSKSHEGRMPSLPGGTPDDAANYYGDSGGR